LLLPSAANRRRNGGWAARSRPPVPPAEAGRTQGPPIAPAMGRDPSGRNAMEDPGAAGVAARRGGTRGQLRPPPDRCRQGTTPARKSALSAEPRVMRSLSEWNETRIRAARREPLRAVERGHAEGGRRQT